MLPSEYLKQGFCQGVIATDVLGNPAPTYGSPEELFDFPRMNFSIIGAINHACSDEMYFDGIYNDLIQFTAALARDELWKEGIELEIPSTNTITREACILETIWVYNNTTWRTQDEAIKLMQNAESVIGITHEMTK